MAYKLIDAAQARWRAVNAPHLVALVRAGVIFHKGKLLERPTDITPAANPPESTGTGGRLKHPDPQVLTISPSLSNSPETTAGIPGGVSSDLFGRDPSRRHVHRHHLRGTEERITRQHDAFQLKSLGRGQQNRTPGGSPGAALRHTLRPHP